MSGAEPPKKKPLLLLVVGAKGAIGSTVAAAVATMRDHSELVTPSLTTHIFGDWLAEFHVAGWDIAEASLSAAIPAHGVLAPDLWQPLARELDQLPIKSAPKSAQPLQDQIQRLVEDIELFKSKHPSASPVLVNLLPAGAGTNCRTCEQLDELYRHADATAFPDLAYVLAAVFCGVPVVNFTPNDVEIPLVLQEAWQRGVPVAGRDGKTGQTYLKVVLASALKARNLVVDGWYSLNLLGNADGANLMDPHRAAGKLSHKTQLLDQILGYRVGERYGVSAHKVHIDYYPPRGDAKEAWDAIDFRGMFGLPMSLRVNLQGRDSILAAPLVMDLARWMAILKLAGRSGPVPELAFYFKRAVGKHPPLTFEDQLASLHQLEADCRARLAAEPAKA
jgi:myo-inositol-1-phosphate synthase